MNKQNTTPRAGFTLIELIIVIGILAILSIAVVLVLNPAEILKKGRDSQRISDLAAIKSAIGLYMATAASPDINPVADSCQDEAGNDEIYLSIPQGTAGFPVAPAGFSFQSVAAVSAGEVDGSGWIPTIITGTSGGAAISTWPIDPTNSQSSANTYAGAPDGNSTPNDLYYQWWCNGANNTFVVVANMESNHFGATSPTEAVEEKDGGDCSELYEVGTDLSLGGNASCQI